jgi:dTDP-glucose 4,6-dehydratase
MMKILVTGCCGFIGTNFVKYVLAQRKGWKIVNLDLLTYAGNPENLKEEASNPDYSFVQGDICDPKAVEQCVAKLGCKPDAIVNFAAESHVDNSIKNPGIFIQTNIQGTLNLLNYAKTNKIRFVQVSTDEVYGSLGATGLFTEETPLAPNSPYSASKAGADMLVRSYVETFGLEAVITRCSNNYGAYQFPEKFIPLAVTNLMEGKTIPVYGDGQNIRDWLHVSDHCSGILLALEKGASGRVYNIGGFNEWKNIDIAYKLLELLGKDESSIRWVEDRLGHDRRYAIDSTRITKELGWEPTYVFETGIRETVQWYQNNETWWKPLKNGGSK